MVLPGQPVPLDGPAPLAAQATQGRPEIREQQVLQVWPDRQVRLVPQGPQVKPDQREALVFRVAQVPQALQAQQDRQDQQVTKVPQDQPD